MKSTLMALLVGVYLSLAGSIAVSSKAGSAPAVKWYRGNTHTHTYWSDGKQLPELVADWYKSHGYDFLVLSDHNVLSRGDKWCDVTAFQKNYKIIEEAQKKFGVDAVVYKEEKGKILVKLNTLEQVRKMVCKTGEFLMIEGEEITGKHDDRPAHANAINVNCHIPPAKGKTMGEQLERYAEDVHEHGCKTGKPVFMLINHPNWKFSNTAEEVAQATRANGVEVMNPDCSNAGDGQHVSTDRLWDIANTLRLKGRNLLPLFGCATDDSHDYLELDAKNANPPGRAWIMVRARELQADVITQAMRDGDFYASTGVSLKDVVYNAEAGTLTVVVDAQPGAEYRIDFIGSYRDADLTPTEVKPMIVKGKEWPITANYDEKVGVQFKSVTGSEATYNLTGKEIYVRARITWVNSAPLAWEDGKLLPQAWTQPVGWEKYIEKH